MFKYLPDLKNKGYVPDTILDIGAHHGDWTANMMNIYPNSKYYLFEGINFFAEILYLNKRIIKNK